MLLENEELSPSHRIHGKNMSHSLKNQRHQLEGVHLGQVRKGCNYRRRG